MTVSVSEDKRPKRSKSRPEVTVVYKKSTFELYVTEKKNARYRSLMQANDPVVSQFTAAHEAHQRSFEQVLGHLEKQGVRYRAVYRAHFRSETPWVIAVGGDGTLLDASRKMSNGILLGVNSDPERSGGFLCSTDASGFPHVFDAVSSGELRATPVPRIGGELDGVPLKQAILNEVLVASRNPADTSRYHLIAPGKDREIHKSSGVWIAAPAGSTGALRSAGGEIQPLDDLRLQFLVREPYIRIGDKVTTRGFFGRDDTLRIISQMREGRIYMDGPHKRLPFSAGSDLMLHARAPALNLVVTPELLARRSDRVLS